MPGSPPNGRALAMALLCASAVACTSEPPAADGDTGSSDATTATTTTTSADDDTTSGDPTLTTTASTSAVTTAEPETTSEGTDEGTEATGGDGSGLQIDGDGFTYDGAPIRLLGVSYFDARDWHPTDLDGLADRGWNLIRIWLDWSDDGFFGPDGTLGPDGAAALLELVTACRERGILVDVTILDPEVLSAPDPAHRSAAAASVATALLDADNVLFDVMNEHDHGAGPIDHAEAGGIVAAVRAVDPDRIVTISSTGGHLVADDATVQTTSVDEELDIVGVAVVTPHLPRTADWASVTGTRVANLRAHLRTRGIVMPIYLQEEARRGHSGLDPSAEEFVLAAQQAFDAGAAGWIFHTDAGFELGDADFFTALDPVEAVVVDTLPATL